MVTAPPFLLHLPSFSTFAHLPPLIFATLLNLPVPSFLPTSRLQETAIPWKQNTRKCRFTGNQSDVSLHDRGKRKKTDSSSAEYCSIPLCFMPSPLSCQPLSPCSPSSPLLPFSRSYVCHAEVNAVLNRNQASAANQVPAPTSHSRLHQRNAVPALAKKPNWQILFLSEQGALQAIKSVLCDRPSLIVYSSLYQHPCAGCRGSM